MLKQLRKAYTKPNIHRSFDKYPPLGKYSPCTIRLHFGE